ncbi:tripartite tricarboxylate transporter substrate binding protein [Ramlibacter sp. AW1]|uniref:Tripartite tricarboxylate transporter substrate binding protein n=1 Tax=Ramlibacter aurantiacus TaxID=2801330 RepID=A0A937D4R2_9BURK|nr:tripartite tricarboxylate transporter substrate binding protein [Ramlibacter aurantiacus]MBL0420577.1 tripartite tricarboxylate transporter substrate binding protein [Ramlibacter aurantiacus]
MTSTQALRRWFGKTLLAGAFAALAAPLALAQDAASFPSKPITLVVPFPAGGSLDVTARIIAEKLKETLGQPVVIANRPGAGSAVGARSVATAPPDGHTLFITSGSAYGYLHLLVPNFEFKLDDFAPIAAVAVNSSVIATNSSFPAKTLPELVNYAKTVPGGVSFCTTGVGGLNHLQLEMLKGLVKTKTGSELNVTHVPYNGLAPVLVGLRGGQVGICTAPFASLVKNLHGKELRVIAVQRPKRLPSLPDVPTTGEQGYPEMDANDAFVNIAAPKGTPQPILAKLESAVLGAMRDPVVRKKIEELDIEVLDMGSAETRKWLEDDVKRLSAVIQKAGLTLK